MRTSWKRLISSFFFSRDGCEYFDYYNWVECVSHRIIKLPNRVGGGWLRIREEGLQEWNVVITRRRMPSGVPHAKSLPTWAVIRRGLSLPSVTSCSRFSCLILVSHWNIYYRILPVHSPRSIISGLIHADSIHCELNTRCPVGGTCVFLRYLFIFSTGFLAHPFSLIRLILSPVSRFRLGSLWDRVPGSPFLLGG